MREKFRLKKTYSYFGMNAVKHGLKAKYFGASQIYTSKLDFLKHPISVRLFGSDIPTFKKIFIEQEYDFNLIHEPKFIIDAGANVGFTSVYFANKYPKCRILAIEPEAGNFGILLKNVELYENITPIKAALWNQNKKINLVDPGRGSWGFTTSEDDENSQDLIDAVTVDYLLEKYGIDKLDILKIDIEGGEKEVFADTSSWLERVETIIIELHERLKSGCNRSFYTGTPGFNAEWKKGENVFITRNSDMIKCV